MQSKTTIEKIKEVVSTAITIKDFKLDNYELNILTENIRQDFSENKIFLTRYLTSNTVVLDNPQNLTLTVGNLNIKYRGIYEIEVVDMSDLIVTNNRADCVLVTVSYRASHIEVTENIIKIKEEEK